MGNKWKSKGRAYLVKQLRERGCSRRQSVAILDLVFHEMSQALKRGEEVEFPLGKLRRVPRSLSELAKPPARRRYGVKWELDGAQGELTLKPSEADEPPSETWLVSST